MRQESGTDEARVGCWWGRSQVLTRQESGTDEAGVGYWRGRSRVLMRQKSGYSWYWRYWRKLMRQVSRSFLFSSRFWLKPFIDTISKPIHTDWPSGKHSPLSKQTSSLSKAACRHIFFHKPSQPLFNDGRMANDQRCEGALRCNINVLCFALSPQKCSLHFLIKW